MTPRHDHGGILLYLAAILLFQSTNALGKTLMLDYPVLQVVWARFLFNFLVFLPLFLTPAFRAFVRPAAWRPQLARSALLYATNMTFFAGIALLPLATAASLMFVGPMILVTLSAFLLSERIGPRRVIAVLAGFAGVVVILRPGLAFTWAALLPLCAAFMYSCYQIVTRRMSTGDPALTTFFCTPLVGAVASTFVAIFFWKTPTPEAWGLMVLMGAVAGGGQFFMIKAFERTEASLLAPYGYTNLVWATIYGFFLFGHLPDEWTIVGATIVIAAGLYIWRRERRLGRPASLS